MSDIDLSIIVPCYNCETTIDEAIESITKYSYPFTYEIILVVVKASSDNSLKTCQELNTLYSTIKIVNDTENLGAAHSRNLGFKQAKGDVCCVLDADNVFDQTSLIKIMNAFKTESLEAAHHESCKRFTKSINKYKTSKFNQFNSFDDLFKFTHWFDHCFFKRSLLEKINYYPIYHHFDHIAMQIKILQYGVNYKIIPGTFYYHRFFDTALSYWEREYSKGTTNLSYFISFENSIHLFSNETVEKILQINLFNKTSNFLSSIKSMYKDNPTTFFDPNYKSYLCQNGVDLYLKQVTTTNDPITIYKKAALNYHKGNYKTALNFYIKILRPFHNNNTIFYNIHKTQLGLSGQYNELTLSFAPLDFYKKIKLDKRKSLRPSFLKKIKEKVISFFKLD